MLMQVAQMRTMSLWFVAKMGWLVQLQWCIMWSLKYEDMIFSSTTLEMFYVVEVVSLFDID